MDRAKLEAQLIQAEKHVLLGKKQIARQQEFVLGLKRLGNNANESGARSEHDTDLGRRPVFRWPPG
jgi:hypothetical protein